MNFKKQFEGIGMMLGIVILPLLFLSIFGITGTADASFGLSEVGAGALFIGAIDMFSTRTLLSALEYMRKPTTFFLDTFFTEVDPVDSDTIDIDIVREGENMAAFVSPLVEGKVVASEGYATHTIKAPYIKEKMLLTPQDLLVRDPGKTIYGPNDSQEIRVQKNLAKKLNIMLTRITRREEWMAAQGLTTGLVNVSGDGVPPRQIDFDMRATHLPLLQNNDRWSQVLTSNPILDLETWVSRILDNSGRLATKVVMGSSAIRLFLDHPAVQAVLNNRRMVVGDVAPSAMANGARKIADWFAPNVEIWTYAGKYIDPATGNRTELMPPNGVLVGCTGTRCERHYAKIQDVETGDALVKYFPKSWTVKDPSGVWIMVQSAPIPAVHEIDAFLMATVN